MDEELLADGITFLPWVGENYELGFNGRRFLVLGESHYDNWAGEQHPLPNTFTRECIEEVIARKGGANFWRTLEQALLNQIRQNGWVEGGDKLWPQLSFYNFVQAPVIGGARVQPENLVFEDSHKPFRQVLECLRPDRVLVCGKRLWNRMPNIPAEDCLHDDVQAYRLDDGTQVWCLATVHPSSGRFGWRELHPLIMAFLADPRTAAGMLRNP